MIGQTDPRRLAGSIIERVFRSQSYADILLDNALKEVSFSSLDRAFTSELVYGVLRWLKRLDWILQQTYDGDWSRVPSIIQRTLEVGLYQLLFLDKVPDYAAVDEAVKIAVIEKGVVWGRTVNYILRQILRRPESQKPPVLGKDPVPSLSIKWSHPEWLVRRWVDTLGIERTESLCEANNVRPKVSIRVNRILADRRKVQKVLREEGIETEPSSLLDEYLIAEKVGDLNASNLFGKGFFSIQDESAGLVGRLLDPKPGEWIFDLAAAPGGKATHMAELSMDGAFILAADVHLSRMRKVMENVSRLGLRNVFPLVTDGRKMAARSADKVLVDAPCSGLGVIRRRGDLRWRRKANDLPKLVSLQKALLEEAGRLIRKGGVLIYSTCTVLPEENEDVVQYFMEKHKHFIVEDARRFVDPSVVSEGGFVETWPDRHGIDGSFAVRLKRVK